MSDDEIFRVLDPDPPSKDSVNGVSGSVKEGLLSANEVPLGNADFVEVVCGR